jgi:quercetin 2,3-dioxygenase
MSLGLFDAGQEITYTFNPNNKCLFLFAIRGRLHVSGHPLPERDAIGIWDTGSIGISCTDAVEFLLIETPVNQK